MTPPEGSAATMADARPPAVAGSFYPAEPQRLRSMVSGMLAEADRRYPRPRDLVPPAGLLVPHAGLEYSGVVAAAAWRLLAVADLEAATEPPTIVILGTNHRAAWLDGIGVWDRGPWRTPLGLLATDVGLADEILALGPPFTADPGAHLGEHSIEVQLPILQAVAPAARIVALAVSTGTGLRAADAGRALGALLARRRASGRRVVAVISTDMAHYPAHLVAERVTAMLEPAILDLDAPALAVREAELRAQGPRGLACGMCGIEPAVVGLAALRAAGATRGVPLAAATSADSGGPPDRTVGYFAAAFTRG